MSRIANRCLDLKLSVTVSAIYWPLILFLPRYLAIPAQSNTDPSSMNIAAMLLIPLPVDLALHLVPALSQLADFIFFERAYGTNETRRVAPLVTIFTTIGYASWTEYLAKVNGICEASILCKLNASD
jgi:hypothetical protein